MCLTLKEDSDLLTADEDISCYKMVTYRKIQGVNTFSSFFMETDVNMGGTYHSELDKLFGRIERGLHSFKNICDCIDVVNAAKIIGHSGVVAVKCVIPKGSRYYKGIFELRVNGMDRSDFPSFASDCIKYEKEITILRD